MSHKWVTRTLLIVLAMTPMADAVRGADNYNDWYTGEHLNHGGFPLGGIGAGMFCMDSTGLISKVSVRNRMQYFNEPLMFAAISVNGDPQSAKVLEGPVPMWKVHDQDGTGNGHGWTSWGLPRFSQARFMARFPFGVLELGDPDNPFDVTVTGWSPFIPGDADNSSLPVAAFEYTFRNRTDAPVQAVFSYHSTNFMEVNQGQGSIQSIPNGFVLAQPGSENNPENEGAFAIMLDGADKVTVDHAWFRGGWWDALTLLWRTVSRAETIANPAQGQASRGASLYAPVSLAPGEQKTLRLMMCWYVPETRLQLGARQSTGPAFGDKPSNGTGAGQQAVGGFLGQGLVNTFDPRGDGQTGTLTSPAFTIEADRIHFLIGGGNQPGRACINLLVNGETKRTSTGNNSETLLWATWNVAEYKGQQARIQIVDQVTGPWAHINIDHIIMSDSAVPADAMAGDHTLIADFEGTDYAGWERSDQDDACCPLDAPKYYQPWYASRFQSIREVADHWRRHYQSLHRESSAFRDALYATTLPAEVVEAVAANLTILKSPTVLRQTDGRLWAFEGCSDNVGCCHGSCTHVWNYAQAIPHLFPSLERTLRETEFYVCQNDEGHQTFRCPLPIAPPEHDFHAAADGQLGGIMKAYREWRISGDDQWLRRIWPRVVQSLDYCIKTWDPRGKGVLDEPHHNTYDIEYWGPNGHCTSVYLGALEAAVRMGAHLDKDVTRYQQLLNNGKTFLQDKLYNGEYFFQIVQTEGLNAEFRPVNPSDNGPGYRDIVGLVNQEGPKYQYGDGCLSDGVFGFWLARACGLSEPADADKIRSHLQAVYRHNLKESLMDHDNPQRPTFAMGSDGGLLLCTWPRGNMPALPFVYSNEVWTGIEYQVAAHCIMHGLVDEGLEIVRLCRDRYDGALRNPFDEYECGHWYARALSSYSLLQALTGVRYDAVERTLYIDSRVGDDFRVFLATETGFGTVGLDNGKPVIEMARGTLDPDRIVISGRVYNP